MSKILFQIKFLLFVQLIVTSLAQLHSQSIQLVPPLPSIERGFVGNDKIKLAYDFRMAGAIVKYTIDQTSPSFTSPTFKDSIIIKDAITLKAKSFHPDFEASEMVTSIFYKKGKPIQKIDINEAEDPYNKLGSKILFDAQLGNLDFSSKYLGFNGKTATAIITFHKKQKLQTLKLSYLVKQGSWIFAPTKIKVESMDGKVIIEKVINDATEAMSSRNFVIDLPLGNIKYKALKLTIEPLLSIPEWSDAKGQAAWFFVDEVWVE